MAHVDQQTGPFAAGEQFSKYEIRGLLGRGGHAFVYHGYDSFLDREVAIKIIVNPAEPGRDLRHRAQLEARVLCRLKHPNVVSVMDAGATESGLVYIIMELLHGRTLRDTLLDLRKLTVREALLVGAHVAAGVQAAHVENAIHRDLKPENVFILDGNAAKVLDFGIAKFLGGAKTTQKDLLHGTMPYMSPEHLQGLGVTPRSDIFALGAMLYETLGGLPPCLVGVQEPTMNVLAWGQINRMPPPLDELTKTVPRHIARVVQRMIAKNPIDRFATMQEVADVLRASAQRVEGEGADNAASPRELWKKAAVNVPAGPHTWTTKIGQPLPFGGTAVFGGPPNDTAPLATLAPIDAAPPPEKPTVWFDTTGETPARNAPKAAVVSATPAPNTAPGLSSGIRANRVSSRTARAITVPKIVAAGLGVGALAGVALGFLAPRRTAGDAAARAPAPSVERPSSSVAVTPPPAVLPPPVVGEEAPADLPSPVAASPTPAPHVAEAPVVTLAAPKNQHTPAALPRRIAAPLGAPAAGPVPPRPHSEPGLPDPGLDDPAPVPVSRPVTRPVRHPVPSAPKPIYGADDIQ